MAIAQTVEKLIKKFGRSGVVIERTPINFSNASTPWIAESPPSNDYLTNLNAVILNEAQVRGNQGLEFLTAANRNFNSPSDTLMEGAVAIAYFIPTQIADFGIEPGDIIRTDTEAYTAMRVDKLKPGTETFLITVQLKE